ncbi:hypothetical protein PFMALIP_04066 [Plasmodium falciparum MaliPS096_E11]|uniref:Uncharacterized protein n=1 Tax=Plasmodium falciparum MaliPS096_E11 TaxID=1036727 RepID=A0A024WMI6_PLAFA|nr:hypothetical protein PFMALIP_04066 [Plasmodium falciparum MaliPS096_E11]
MLNSKYIFFLTKNFISPLKKKGKKIKRIILCALIFKLCITLCRNLVILFFNMIHLNFSPNVQFIISICTKIISL